MSYLLITLAVIVALVVLYLVGRKVKPFGKSLGFVCAVAGRLLVKIAQYADKAADYCYKACIASLRYPPGVSDSDYWHGVNVISRLVYFVLAVCILLGETVNTLLVLPALFGTKSTVNLPGVVEISSAALFICCPALAGASIAELCGLIPHSAGLFPRLSTVKRWVLGILLAVVLVLAILVTGYFYVYRAAYLLDPESTQGMSLYILGGLGLETAAMSVLALWAFSVGGAGVVSLVMWIAEQVARGISAIASLPPHLLDTLALHLTAGETGVWGEQIERDPHKYPQFPASTAQAFSPGQKPTALVPQNASTMVDAVGEIVVPIETQEMEIFPMNLEKNASVLCSGSDFADPMFQLLAEAIYELDAVGCFKSSARIVQRRNYRQTAIAGLVDMTPTLLQRLAVSLHSDTIAEVCKKLMDVLPDTIIEVHGDLKAVRAPMIFCLSCHDLIEAEGCLVSLKHRYPLCSIVVVTEVSPYDVQDKSVQVGIASLQALQKEGTVEVFLVTHTNSPLASNVGLALQRRHLAHLLVSLTIAHTHSHNNPSFVDVLQELHSLSSVVTSASASASVAVGKLPKRFSRVPFVKGHIGSGILTDILAQSQGVIDKVHTDEETGMFPLPADPGARRIVLVKVPIELSDSRFETCVQENALYTSQHYPNSTCITVRGNGIAPLHYIGSRFLVTASCLTPIPNPASLLRVPIDTSVKVTQLHPFPATPEPSSTNSHVSALPKPVAKASKAVTTTRQKKASGSTRHVVRKNTKQAK